MEVSIGDTHHLHKQPLVRRVPRRQHPVTLLCGDNPAEVGAVVIRFGEGEIAAVERAVTGEERAFGDEPIAHAKIVGYHCQELGLQRVEVRVTLAR